MHLRGEGRQGYLPRARVVRQRHTVPPVGPKTSRRRLQALSRQMMTRTRACSGSSVGTIVRGKRGRACSMRCEGHGASERAAAGDSVDIALPQLSLIVHGAAVQCFDVARVRDAATMARFNVRAGRPLAMCSL